MCQPAEVELRMDLAGYVETKGTGIFGLGTNGKNTETGRRIGYLGKKMSLLGRESDTEQ